MTSYNLISNCFDAHFGFLLFLEASTIQYSYRLSTVVWTKLIASTRIQFFPCMHSFKFDEEVKISD